MVIGSAIELSGTSMAADDSGVTFGFCGLPAPRVNDTDVVSDSDACGTVVDATWLDSTSDDTVEDDISAVELIFEVTIVAVVVGSGVELSSGTDDAASVTGRSVLEMGSNVTSSVGVGSGLGSASGGDVTVSVTGNSVLEMSSDVAASVVVGSKLEVVSGKDSVNSAIGSSVLEIISDVAVSLAEGMALDSGSVVVTGVVVGTRLEMTGVSIAVGVSVVITTSDVDGSSSCCAEVDGSPSVVGTITTGIDVSGTSNSGS